MSEQPLAPMSEPSRLARTVVFTGLALLVAASVVFGAITLRKLTREWAADKAYAAGWEVSGPACPRIAEDRYSQLGIDRPTPIAFEDIRGYFAYGGVNCTEIDFYNDRPSPPYPVCQFSSPFVIHLTNAKPGLYFEPGVGRPVTLSVRDGVARCVLASKLTHW